MKITDVKFLGRNSTIVLNLSKFFLKFFAVIHGLMQIGILFLMCSCESFVAVEVPSSRIIASQVFGNDIAATSAVNGIYVDLLRGGSFACGDHQSVVALAGLSSDELSNYLQSPDFMEFNENRLRKENPHTLNLWTSAYKTVYQTNAVLEGLANSNSITKKTLSQLQGEVHFIRAFSYFYLVNLFGDVPLTTTTNYHLNAVIPLSPQAEIYKQIESDLILAHNQLNDEYITIERVRPNRYAANALLARVYLYLKMWPAAEANATKIIENSSVYGLVDDLNEVFLGNSREAIWQLRPVVPDFNTYEGYTFIVSGRPDYNILNDSFLHAFENGDNRRQKWIGSFDAGDDSLFFPYKYKVNGFGTQLTEYSMVLRLAEQYLIRAEARIHQGNLDGAVDDIDAIRSRAGLAPIRDTNPEYNAEDLLFAIEQERRVELFAEWGHRWLDLKRTERADEVLSVSKIYWSSEDKVYPIPQDERDKNPNLN